MSEHDDTLLDEDLGDEEYDLGNDEEEALLADDYELERQNSYKGEEETDDVLDLGVTDALDDLDAEDENVEFNRSNAERNNDNDFYEDADHQPVRAKYYEQQQDEMNASYKGGEQTRLHDGTMLGIVNCSTSNIGKGDLREKLQKNAKIYAATGPITLEDEECEEARERRNRFQNERTIVSPKMNSNIPDSLENVVTCEPNRLMSRGRGRGRSARGCRGGRFATQNLGNFNPRFANTRNSGFDNQPPPGCRPPLLETRPPFPLGAPNSVQNQQLLYQQQNAQTQHFQHYTSSSSVQPPAAQFVDNRPQFNPNQFQGQMGPRLVGPRLDYGPRSGLPSALPGQPYNHSQNQPPFVQMQGSGNIPQGSFQNSSAMIQENQLRLMHNNPGPLLHRNLSGGSGAGGHLGNLNPMIAGTSTTLLQGNPSLPVQGFPRQPLSQQGPLINHPNANQMSNQTPFENRPPFQESTQFENRSVYDTRSGYSDQVPTSQFNSNTLPVPQQSTPNVPTVPLPSGHKILINPHFRGAVQSVNDASLAWDSGQQQQTPLPSHIPSSQFSQSINSYQNQNSYNQATHGPPHYQQNYQHNKKDDPYAYFSDVWQENKPQKCLGGSNSSKQYSSEAGYPRDDGYEGTAKYKSDQWEQRNEHQPDHRGAHQSYRDRDLSSRSRGLNDLHLPKPRTTSSTIYRESYNQNHVQKAGTRSVPTSIRAKVPQKRTPEPVDRPLRDLSPKRMKPNNRNLHEVRTVDTLTNISTEKKEEESDPEMLEYRKKMEEQKRLREKILREKENRRKMAAMEKQNEKTKKENNTLNEGTQETKSGSVLMGVAKDASVINKGHNISVGRGRGRPINAQSTEANEKQSCIRIVRKLQTVQSNDSMEPRTDNNAYTINEQHPNKILGSQPGSRRVVIQKPLSDMQKFAIIIQKAVSNLQRGQLVAQNKLNAVQGAVGQRGNEEGQSDLSKKIASVGQKGGDLAKQKSPGGPQRTQGNVHQGSSQRIVLQKTPIHQQQKKTTEIKTNTVKVENLAASTSEPQIRRMCQGIGTIESIQMGERSATIVFKTQSAATVFHKKYQRKMVDLSLITVRLVPQSSGNKSSPASVVKVS